MPLHCVYTLRNLDLVSIGPYGTLEIFLASSAITQIVVLNSTRSSATAICLAQFPLAMCHVHDLSTFI